MPALADCGHPEEVLQREVEEDSEKQLVGQVVPWNACWGRWWWWWTRAEYGSYHMCTNYNAAGYRWSENCFLPDVHSFFLLDLLARTNWLPSFSLPLLRSRWCLWVGDHCWMSSVGVHSVSRPSLRKPFDLRLLVLLDWDNMEPWGLRQGRSRSGMLVEGQTNQTLSYQNVCEVTRQLILYPRSNVSDNDVLAKLPSFLQWSTSVCPPYWCSYQRCAPPILTPAEQTNTLSCVSGDVCGLNLFFFILTFSLYFTVHYAGRRNRHEAWLRWKRGIDETSFSLK